MARQSPLRLSQYWNTHDKVVNIAPRMSNTLQNNERKEIIRLRRYAIAFAGRLFIFSTEERKEKMISDEESILLCAIRYACGRQTYMPGIVIGYITPKLKEISTYALHIIDSDLTSSRSRSGGMGDEKIDKTGWIRFHDAVRSELISRGEMPVNLSRG